MKKILGMMFLILSIFGLASCQEEEAYKPNINYEIIDSYIEEVMTKTDSFIPYWNQESFKGKWNYIDGVMLTSLLSLYKKTNDAKYKDFVVNYVNYYIDERGNFLNLKNPDDLGYNILNFALDDICSSRVLFDLFEYTNDERYERAITNTFKHVKKQPRTTEGNFWHKKEYTNQVWLDGLYMVNPFYVLYANKYKDGTIKVNDKEISYYEDIYNQYKMVRENMFDEEKKLYYHGYDSSKTIFWADSETGCSKNFWLRSMGWYIVSLVDVLEHYPDGDNKEYLKSLLQEAINGLLMYQDSESKMFYQLIDKGELSVLVPGQYFPKTEVEEYRSNYLESSGSSMIAYTLMKGARLGYLDKDMYNKGAEIFEGVCNKYLKEENGSLSLYGICITAGLGPENKTYRDGSVEYYLSETVGSNDAKGVGPFVMAYTELLM